MEFAYKESFAKMKTNNQKENMSATTTLTPTLTKHALAIQAIEVCHASKQFTPEDLYQMLDLLLGYRTNGETWEVVAYIKSQGIALQS